MELLPRLQFTTVTKSRRDGYFEVPIFNNRKTDQNDPNEGSRFLQIRISWHKDNGKSLFVQNTRGSILSVVLDVCLYPKTDQVLVCKV